MFTLVEHHLCLLLAAVGHEGKYPEEIAGMGSWECGGAFYGQDGETEGETCLGCGACG